MLGITVGVATVLAMMAVGAGAQRSIEQQVRAAGLNQLTIRAGNWRPKVEDSGERRRPPGRRARHRCGIRSIAPADCSGRSVDDVRQDRVPSRRRSDGEARSSDGAAAARRSRGRPRLGGDADVRRCRGDPRASTACSTWPAACTSNVRVHVGDKRWFTRMHGTDVHDAVDQARVDVHRRPLLHRARAGARRAGGGARPGRGREAVRRRRRIRSARRSRSGTSPSRSSASSPARRWVVQPAPGDDQFDAVYMPYTTTHRLLNLTKLNDITVTAASSGDVSRLSREITKLLRAAPRHRRQRPGRLHHHHAGDQGARRPAACRRAWRAAVAGNVAELEKVTLEQLAMTLERASRTMTLAAGRGGGGVAAGRRHRHHEHHAAVGDRAHQGDRPAHGGRRARHAT